jgi:hypothetical protein
MRRPERSECPRAGAPWLEVFCPGCRTSRDLDLRTLDRHPLASVGTLVLGLRRGADAFWVGRGPLPAQDTPHTPEVGTALAWVTAPERAISIGAVRRT